MTLAVSNRGPLTFRFGPDQSLEPVPAGGGLASSLRTLLTGTGATWVSVTMGAADRAAAAAGLMVGDGIRLVPVPIDDDTYRRAYDVVANTTLWYCHHHLFDLPHRPRFDRSWRLAWDGFQSYNRAVADVVVDAAADGEVVLVQDYHFSLLGRMLAERRPDLRTVHFLHTPFADPNMLAVLPDEVVAEILDGMSGFGACGFHCAKWEAGFVACFAAAGLPIPPPRSSRPWHPTRTSCWPTRHRPSAPAPPKPYGPRRVVAGSSCGPIAWNPPRTSCGACWRSRNCSSRTRNGAARSCIWFWPTRRGRGWPSISLTRPM